MSPVFGSAIILAVLAGLWRLLKDEWPWEVLGSLYLRHGRGPRRALAAMDTRHAIELFTHEAGHHARGGVQAEASWLEVQAQDVVAAPDDRVYEVFLCARHPRVPPFLELRAPIFTSSSLLQELPPRVARKVEDFGRWPQAAVHQGAVSCRAVVLPGESPPELLPRLHRDLERCVEVARLLARLHPRAPAWLLRQLEQAPALSRASWLRQLCGAYPDAPQTRQACQQALHDPDRALRLLAALHLGEEPLWPFVEHVSPADLPAETWQAVLDRYGASDATAQRLELLQRTLAAPSAVLVRRALAELEALPRAPEPRRFAARAETCWDPELLSLYALALGRAEGTELEPLALQIVARAAELEAELREPVQKRAAWALGRVGRAPGRAALEKLASSWRAPEGVRQAARLALEDLQQRLQGVEAGGLAVVEGHGGDLSLLPASGQLELASTSGDDEEQREG